MLSMMFTNANRLDTCLEFIGVVSIIVVIILIIVILGLIETAA